MVEQFYEDMGRKAQWFRDIHGTNDEAVLDPLREKALAQVEVMRQARITRRDPGRGPLDKAVVLLGAGRRAVLAETSLPGHVDEGFITAPVKVRSTEEDLGFAMKQRLKRGAQPALDPRTARMFRFDAEREKWTLIHNSGWNAQDKYVWGHVDQPGVYVAVALPKDPDAVKRIALEALARRVVRNAVASGHFASAADLTDRDAFRSWFLEANGLDEDAAAAKQELALASKAQREMVRQLGRAWLPEPFGGKPQWSVLDDIVFHLDDVRKAIDLDLFFPYRPLFHRVSNRVGPWFQLGPYNINGRVKSIAMNPTDSDILYAGAAAGGVWKSTNGGMSWSTRWKFEDSLNVSAVATAPSNANVVYAGTGEDAPGWGFGYGGAGIYKTTNAGGTWNRIATSTEVGNRVNKIVVHPAASKRVLVATSNGVYRAEYAPVTGAVPSWNRVLSGRCTDLVMRHDAPEVMLAGIHGDGIYKTTNGGDTWARLSGDRVVVFALLFAWREAMPTGAAAGWIKLALGRSGEQGSNFVVAKMGPDSATTLISGDAGEEWLKTPGSVGVEYDEWCSLVAVHPRQPRHIYLGAVGLQHSHGGWSYENSPGTHADHHQMAFHHSNTNTAYVCCDGGVYRTTNNGSSWHLRSDYLVATQLLSLGVSQAGDLVIGSSTQDQGIIQTNGSPYWTNHGGGNEWGMFVVDPNDSRNIFISPGSGQIRRSVNRGVSYSNPTSGLTDWWAAMNRNTIAASFAHAAVKPGDSSVVVGVATVGEKATNAAGATVTYADVHRVYYSGDGGSNWARAFTLPHRGSRVAFAPIDPSRVYAATSQGRVYRSSSSGGSGWSEPCTAANRPPAGSITAIAVDPFNKNRVYITYGDVDPHIYRSTDGGQTWAACNGTDPSMQLPNIALLDVVVDTENRDVLYVGSDIGVFRSNDRGSTWYWANDSLEEHDLPRVPVTGLAIHPSTHRLYAATLGRGLYYTQATGIASLRATHVQLRDESPQPMGIVKLRLTDGTTTYTMTRLEVIRRIQAGTEVYTIGSDGARARVRTLQPDAVHPLEYLSTSPDSTTGNNLLHLPRFYG